MAKRSRKIDLLRPDVTPAGMVEALSFPQHEVQREVIAEQKHHEKHVATTLPYYFKNNRKRVRERIQFIRMNK